MNSLEDKIESTDCITIDSIDFSLCYCENSTYEQFKCKKCNGYDFNSLPPQEYAPDENDAIHILLKPNCHHTLPSKINEHELCPDFIEPIKWRTDKSEKLDSSKWREIREQILKRDNFSCIFCRIKWDKYQIVDHINGNNTDNNSANLRTLCPMCNLIRHAGFGCVVAGIVDLYKYSKYSQNEIMKITWQMRLSGKSDEEIIKFLALQEKVDFRMDRNYLYSLKGFVTSRIPKESSLINAYAYYKNIIPTFISGQSASISTNVYWIFAFNLKDYPKSTTNSGKWLIFVELKDLDETWSKIKKATEEGLLGGSSKCATAKLSPLATDPNMRVICVYTYDWTDQKDVKRIREELRKLGVTKKIPYKSDEDTRNKKYSNSVSNISKYYE